MRPECIDWMILGGMNSYHGSDVWFDGDTQYMLRAVPDHMAFAMVGLGTL